MIWRFWGPLVSGSGPPVIQSPQLRMTMTLKSAIRRLRDLWRGAAGAGLAERPRERPHPSLPCREAAAAPWRCSGRIIQRSPLERGTQWIW